MSFCSSVFCYFNEQVENRLGFDDVEMFSLANKIPAMKIIIEKMCKLGFRYSGDTKSDSKAFTDVVKKRIFIGRDKTVNEACLSLMYEMTNAINGTRIKDVHNSYLKDKVPSMERAVQYAHEILRVESEAVFNRSIVAISLGFENLIKNKKYIEIIKLNDGNINYSLRDISLEMITNGTVHNGKKKAVDHYISQYFEWNNK